MPLTDIVIKNAKPKDKQYKISDTDGMFLLILPNGGKYFRLKYRVAGKEKLLAIGVYPDISLKEAREKRDEARKMIRDGIDPSQAKKEVKQQILQKTEHTFENVTREWHTKNTPSWDAKYSITILRRLEADIFPPLGSRPIKEITAPELLKALQKIEDRNAVETAHRMLQACGQIFRYAIVTGRADKDISIDIKGALSSRKRKHHAYLKESELPEFFSKLELYDGDLQTKLALKFLILTFVRTTEVRGARWEEINFEKQEWRIPPERMKMNDLHIVPLSKQAIAILGDMKAISGDREHIFPNRNKPNTFISENTMLYAIYRLGYHSRTTTHGFRAAASTILNERGFSADIIERQLSHVERNKIRGAYNHAQYMPERIKMMQWWADFIDSMSGNGQVIEGNFG